MSTTRPGLYQPTIDNDFILEPATRRLFRSLVSLAQTGNFKNTLMTGPTGSGKTSVSEQFAAIMQLPFLKMDCPRIRESRDWFGEKTAVSGTVSWRQSAFAQAVNEGNVVILLDEISRSSPLVLNGLLPILDHSRQTYLEELGETLKVGANTYFFATANVGNQYSGTHRLDAAIEDRFDIRILCDYLPMAEEAGLLVRKTGISQELAQKLAVIAAKIRRQVAQGGTLTKPISTRTLISTAALLQDMGKTGVAEDAFKYTLLPLYSAEGGTNSERAQILQVIQAQFGDQAGAS